MDLICGRFSSIIPRVLASVPARFARFCAFSKSFTRSMVTFSSVARSFSVCSSCCASGAMSLILFVNALKSR